MAFKNRLLATAAIPLVALIGLGPVSAAEIIRPAVPADAQSLVVKVQSSDDQEQLKKQQRKERRQQEQQNQNNEQNDQNQKRKNRQDQNAGQQEQQDNTSQRRNKQNNDAGMQQQDESQQPRRKKHEQSQDNTVQTIDNGDQQEQVKPRHKKNNDNAESQQNSDQNQQSDQQEQVKPRHKKNNDNAESQQNTDQGQQSDQQEQVKPRHKKNNDNAESQQNTDQTQQNDQEQVKPRHKKNNDNAESQQNTDQTQQNDQEQGKPRHKKDQNADNGQQNDNNASSDQGQSENDKLKNAIEKSNKKHRKNQDQADQPTDNAGSSIEKIQTKKKDQQQNDENATSDDNNKPRKNAQPVDVKKAKDIAADPSKTTDTVVLPVDNGAAVLDSDKDADNRGADRNRRKQQREENKDVQAPKSDKDAQRGFKNDEEVRIRPVLQEKGERIPGFKGYDDAGGRRVDDRSNRVVINIDGRLVIRGDDDRRLARDQQIRYDRLPNSQIREVIVMPNGDRIVTVRNRWGEIIRRSRIINDREVVIFYSPELERGRDRLFLRDPGDDLPPMRLTIPLRDYIVDVSGSGGGSRDYEDFLDEPPVERVERVYSVDEVKNSARIRDKMRRIDLDTITFDTGSSEIAEDQVQSLKKVGQAIKAIIDKDPGETFLIEGHTDAVGSDESNLVLSDSRAEAVANVLSDAFDIPAENLTTQGYGERYLKVNTDGPERLNRRVTIRRITPLVRPANASADAE